MLIAIEPIGYIHNNYSDTTSPEIIKNEVSVIELLSEYYEGLQKVEDTTFLDIVFYFHKEKRTELVTRVRNGETRGIFASRSPLRPNHIGVTTVKLIKIEKNLLYIEGLDALDGTPVIDIKCCDTSLLENEHIHKAISVQDPRIDIMKNILMDDKNALLLKAAQFHGHVCPGLAIGVMASTSVMKLIYEKGEDEKKYHLIVNMSKCPVDGILLVTGCSLGTGRITFGNPEEMSFMLLDDEQKGWKVILNNHAKKTLEYHLSSYNTSYEKGLACLELDASLLFTIEEV